jgi:hypothetical protein
MTIPKRQTWSFKNARSLLDDDAMAEIVEIKDIFDELGGGNDTKRQRDERFKPLGWEAEKTARFTADIAPHMEEDADSLSRTIDFDAYKPGIALEHERIEMMRAAWHLTKMDGTQRGLDQSGLDVDVGVLLIPKGAIASDDPDKQAGLRRVQETIRTLMSPVAKFSTPLFVWEYVPES